MMPIARPGGVNVGATPPARVIALCHLPPPALAQLRRALLPPHQVRSAASWEELIGHVARRGGDVVIVDPCTAPEREPGARVRLLGAALQCAHGTPVVGYVSVTAAAIHAVQALVRLGAAEIVVRGVDDATASLASAIHRAAAGALTQRLLQSLGTPFAPLPGDVAAALHLLFRRPERLRSVPDLAGAAGTTRRSLDRWLARAGLAPARTLLSCARANAAYQLIAAGRVRTAQAAALLGYPSSRALARELQALTGYVPSALPGQVSADDFIAALGPRLLRANSRAAARSSS